ncbi:reverse transcriptase domain-containing protein [Tanacetum coccineum]
MDPPGDIMVKSSPPKRLCGGGRFDAGIHFAFHYTKMPTSWLNIIVTRATTRKNFTKDEMPQNSIHVCEILALWASPSWDRSHLLGGNTKYILCFLGAVDYMLKWVEAKALPTNDARVVCIFLKSLFARFGAPRAIISDCGTHFCNDQFAKWFMLKYELPLSLQRITHRQVDS